MTQLTAKASRVVQELAPGAIVTLFEIDVSAADPEEPPFCFHSGTNEVGNSIVYNGATYRYFPIESEGWEHNADGPLPRPKLRCSNVGGDLGRVARELGDLIGCKLKKIEVPARYLDAVNFVNGNPLADASATLSVEEYWIERKPTQNLTVLEFELASALEAEGQMAPGRQVVGNCCMWRKYRGDGCGYTGTQYFNARNEPVATAAEDVCAKNMKACDLRHTIAAGVTVLAPPQYEAYAALVKQTGTVLDTAMTPDPEVNKIWPKGWKALGGRSFRATQCRRGAANKVMPFLDLHFAGEVVAAQVMLASFGGSPSDVSRVQDRWLGAWLQTVEGKYPDGVSLWLAAFAYDDKLFGGRVGAFKLREVTSTDLKNWAYFQGQVPHYPEWATPLNGGESDRMWVQGANVGLLMEFPTDYVTRWYEDGTVEHAGQTLDFWIRIGLPALLPSPVPDLMVVPQPVVQTQYTRQPLPFGGFPGASLAQS